MANAERRGSEYIASTLWRHSSALRGASAGNYTPFSERFHFGIIPPCPCYVPRISYPAVCVGDEVQEVRDWFGRVRCADRLGEPTL